ncbi:MAG TPA: TIGR03435 family protein [Verrucomicrobiae bacterium]|nr:TIGR03435 family protein [Verrucomicrobiae bacterium]
MKHMKLPAAMTLALWAAFPALTRAQTGELPRFDVASVKVSAQQFLAIAPARSGGRIQWTTDLWDVLEYAYRMQSWQISGPVPGSTSIYDFEVATSAGASDDEVRRMFQTLLIDRFKMASHRQTKEMDGYGLTLAKGGSRMEAAKGKEIPPLPEWIRAHSGDAAQMEGLVVSMKNEKFIDNLVGRRATMPQLSAAIQRIVGAPVFERTGLTGSYYFALQYASDNAPPEVTLPNLFAAIRELGLKLEKQKGPVEMLVVDRIEQTPTAN